MISQAIILAAFACLAAASGIIMPVAHAPQPYKFGYDIKDKLSQQYRQESGNGAGGVAGSYGFTDARGVQRQVDYVADHAGFRAAVKTNEPGTANQNPAAVQMISAAPYAGGVATLGGVGLGGIVDGRLGLVGPVGGIADGRLGLVGPVGGIVDGRLGLSGGIVDGRLGLAGGIVDGRLGLSGGIIDGRLGLAGGIVDSRLGLARPIGGAGLIGGARGIGSGLLGGLGYARYGY